MPQQTAQQMSQQTSQQLVEILQAVATQEFSADQSDELYDWLYDHWITGYQEAELDMADINNQRVSGLDLPFATALHQQNCGDGYWDSGWTVISQDLPKYVNVCKQQLTLQATMTKHLRSPQSPAIGDIVDLRLPKNLVVGDRYVAVANAGKPTGALTQIFFHLDQTHVATIIQRITQDLNQQNIAFTLAVLYDPLDYPRRDAAILQIAQTDMAHLSSRLYDWAKDWQPLLRSTVPIFTTPLFPGVSYFKPSQPTDSLDQRCEILADAIMAALPYELDAQVKLVRDRLQAAEIGYNI
jgi:hypothetical protein